MTMAPSVSGRDAATAPADDTSVLAVQRRLAALLPSAGWIDSPGSLEIASLGSQEPPRLISASILEGESLRAHEVVGHAAPRFAAFLDGTQTSKVIAYVEGMPIVHGVVAAAVRERVDRCLRTWTAPIVRRAVYAPVTSLSAASRMALAGIGARLVDTVEQASTASLSHPFALQDAAVHTIQREREAAERELAELWCARADEPLFVDGSIAGSERIATSAHVVGVVKSHLTLYAEGDALRTIMGLGRGERSSVFRITSPKRTPVASWYLRLRDSTGHDPLFGLVRVEMADARGTASSIAARAGELSRWVLAEALPLAVPDGRWDKMVYGIRDCEEFLRAIQ